MAHLSTNLQSCVIEMFVFHGSKSICTDSLLDPKTASKRADCEKALEEIMDRS